MEKRIKFSCSKIVAVVFSLGLMVVSWGQTGSLAGSQSWADIAGLTGIKPSVEAEKQDPEKQLKMSCTGESEQDGDIISLKGSVRLEYKGILVTCDEAKGNVKTKRFDVKGNITVVGKGIDFKGEELSVDLEARSLSFPKTQTKLSQEIVGKELTGNIYISGGRGGGTEERFQLSETELTTCDHPDHPHYHLEAQKLVIRPQRSLQMRNVKLRIGRKTIITLPYLSVPLNDSLPKYFPQIGQSSDEGFFIKARFGIGTKGDEIWDARVEIMTKLGIGLGSEYDYKYKKSSGKFNLYGILGKQGTITVNQNHAQKLSVWDLNSDFRYSKQNYETSPETTNTSLRLNVANIGKMGSLRLGYTTSKSENGNFSSKNDTYTFQTTLSNENRFKFSTDATYINSGTSGSSFNQSRKVLDLKMSAAQEFSSLSTELLYQRSIPVGVVSGFFSQTDITPQFSVLTDSKRLLKTKWVAPFKMSYGEYIDPIRKDTINRVYFDAQTPQLPLKSGRTSINTRGRFRQGIYSDDTAQFILEYSSDFTYEPRKGQSLNLRYGFLRQQGFTPLSSDRSGRNDQLQLSLRSESGKSWTNEITTGYDFWDGSTGGVPWQSVGIRTTYNQGEKFKLTQSILYDTFNQNWSTIRTDFDYKPSKGPRFQGGLRFDGAQHTFGAFNLLIEGFKFGKTTTSFLATFNGYTGRFDSRQARVIYDLHCTEAIFTITDQQTGFRNGTTFGFYIRIKAFPSAAPFGVGPRGQSFGLGGQNL